MNIPTIIGAMQWAVTTDTMVTVAITLALFVLGRYLDSIAKLNRTSASTFLTRNIHRISLAVSACWFVYFAFSKPTLTISSLAAMLMFLFVAINSAVTEEVNRLLDYQWKLHEKTMEEIKKLSQINQV